MAIIPTPPASPLPTVLVSITVSPHTSTDSAIISTPSAFPTAPVATWLSTKPPSNLTLSFPAIVILPVSPFPKVLVDITASPRTSTELAIISTPPAFPSASDSTVLNAPLPNPSNLISVACIMILLASPLPKVLAPILVPLSTSIDLAVISKLPPFPTPKTSLKIKLLLILIFAVALIFISPAIACGALASPAIPASN